MRESAVELQRRYYAGTAHEYDVQHVDEGHELSLAIVAHDIERYGWASVLDTGCGTGRAMKYLAERLPDIELHGNDPSAELLDASGLSASQLTCCGSESLPFADGAFDVVVETGVLHHVPEPARVVGEMLRVARCAVYLSDSNIYGRGHGRTKLILARAGLLRPLNCLRRGGHDWFYSEGDGVAYSYSVFDSYVQVARACGEVRIHPLDGCGKTALFGSPTVLLAGFK